MSDDALNMLKVKIDEFIKTVKSDILSRGEINETMSQWDRIERHISSDK